MKKIIFSLLCLMEIMSVNAQIFKVYKNDVLDTTYITSTANKFKVVMEDMAFKIYKNGTLDATYSDNASCKYKIVTKEVEHEYVDLGLPSGTLWATCNVGANVPEDYGNYYAWGEVKPQSSNAYSWASYELAKGTSTTLTKYCTSTSCGTVDNKTILEPENDAATYNWGSDWKMPTYAQLAELENPSYTTITSIYRNGIYGRLFTSGINGNSIFLPAGGYRYDNISYKIGAHCYYWTNTLSTSQNASDFEYRKTKYEMLSQPRYKGMSVRPVLSSNAVRATSISLNVSTTTLTVRNYVILIATILPENVTSKACRWSSSNTSIATVDATGKVTGVSAGTVTITCTANDGSGKETTCEIMVLSDPNLIFGSFSVSESKQVQFTKGNLYWDGRQYKLEETQIASSQGNNLSYDTCHVSHFFWTNSTDYASGNSSYMPFSKSYDHGDRSNDDELFCGENNQLSIYGTKGLYVLSCTEWNYLINKRANANNLYKCGVTVDDAKNCLIIAPDDYNYSSNPLKATYTLDELSELGIVCLPAAGFRQLSCMSAAGTWGYYLSSSPSSNAYASYAYCFGFISNSVYPSGSTWRENGYSIRLVRNVDDVTQAELHEYVDLGLPSGTLWATCNMGADSPEEYGDYYAWGETVPQSDNQYDWSSYKWSKGSYNTLTKYNTSSNYGVVDNEIVLDPSDDAATVNWGEKWQMPSVDQIEELSSYTNITWTARNGIYGELVTSKVKGYTNKSIFLPAAGYFHGGSANSVGSIGVYWAQENGINYGSSKWDYYARYLYFQSKSVQLVCNSDKRCDGQSIRPVRVK